MCLQVRSIARKCYRVFAKFWPDRARRVFLVLDPTIQKVSNKSHIITYDKAIKNVFKTNC